MKGEQDGALRAHNETSVVTEGERTKLAEHTPTNWRALTDRQIIDAMNEDTAVNRVRRVFSGESARLEQAGMQRRPPGPVDYRRMEFEAADKLLIAAGDKSSTARIAALEAALEGLLAVLADSLGVVGYHLNGDIAEWDEFEEVAIARALLPQASEVNNG